MEKINIITLVAHLIATALSTNLSAQIVSVTPDTIEQGVLLDIEVTAENIDFTQGTNGVSLKNGSRYFYPDMKVNNSTSMTLNTIISTDYPTGSYDLSIYNTGSDVTLTKSNAVFLKPDLSVASFDSISPVKGSQGETITITIHGTNTNFNKTNASNTVYLYNLTTIYPTQISAIDSLTLEAKFELTYGHQSGDYTVHLINKYDGTHEIQDGFKLMAGSNQPTIVSISPDTAVIGEKLYIEVTAENIDFTQGTNAVSFKQGPTYLSADNMIVNNSTSMTISKVFNKDNPTGYYDLSIFNTGSGATLTKLNGLYLIPDLTEARLDSISPAKASQDDTITITIYGTNTNFNKNGVSNMVYLDNSFKRIYSNQLNIIDSVTLEAKFEFTYAHQTGLYSIYVKNNFDGTLSIHNGFTLSAGQNPPAITSVNPDTITVGQTLDITVTAENIDFTQGTNGVTLKKGNTEIFMNSSSAKSPTSLQFNITLNKNLQTGIYDLEIYNTSFGLVLTNNTLLKEQALVLKQSVSVKEIFNDIQLFYPNPAINGINISEFVDRVYIYDLNGRMILDARNEQFIDISHVKNGIYAIKLKVGSNIVHKKLLIH